VNERRVVSSLLFALGLSIACLSREISENETNIIVAVLMREFSELSLFPPKTLFLFLVRDRGVRCA
jgi:hypothetical protein